MNRRLIMALAAAVWIVLPLAAQEGIRRGKIKRVDVDRGVIAIAADGKDEEFLVTQQTRMVGPTNQGFDDRMARAADSRYANDTPDNFLPDNPHVVIFPLVDWQSINGGRASIQLKGFAAFWITRYSGGDIYGRFVRTVEMGTGTPGGSTFDAGLYSVRMTE